MHDEHLPKLVSNDADMVLNTLYYCIQEYLRIILQKKLLAVKVLPYVSCMSGFVCFDYECFVQYFQALPCDCDLYLSAWAHVLLFAVVNPKP